MNELSTADLLEQYRQALRESRDACMASNAAFVARAEMDRIMRAAETRLSEVGTLLMLRLRQEAGVEPTARADAADAHHPLSSLWVPTQ